MILSMEVFEKAVYPLNVKCMCGCNLQYLEKVEITLKEGHDNILKCPLLLGALVTQHIDCDRN